MVSDLVEAPFIASRQLMEKCTEQRMPLYQDFVDLTKAFDTVNREALWIVQSKYGCSTAFVDKLKILHLKSLRLIMVSSKVIYWRPLSSPYNLRYCCGTPFMIAIKVYIFDSALPGAYSI